LNSKVLSRCSAPDRPIWPVLDKEARPVTLAIRSFVIFNFLLGELACIGQEGRRKAAIY